MTIAFLFIHFVNLVEKYIINFNISTKEAQTVHKKMIQTALKKLIYGSFCSA